MKFIVLFLFGRYDYGGIVEFGELNGDLNDSFIIFLWLLLINLITGGLGVINTRC